MSEMIERVARAICLEQGYHPEELSMFIRGRKGARPRWEGYESEARAAIEAMREPTGAMVAAAFDEGDDLIKARLWWQAMIDAALGEK